MLYSRGGIGRRILTAFAFTEMQNKFKDILENDLDLWNSSVDDESVTWAPSAATELDRVTGKPLDELTTCKNAQRFYG